ncbi:SHOCT domain-containing protein [Amycolatopsis aidingensis]|uniref:SHOCT domain-containing protein n=1 Tax=Amycolatopsis aidingensis TaxID=2842453 RepID=UPI001E2DFAF1|nr:SHOCT domain-containing protein [Amycolatopsis aidingensis]
MHWYVDHPGQGWLGWILMIVAMVLFWGGLVTVIVLLLRRLARPDRTPAAPEAEPAEGILAARFARGEIDEEEYRRRRAALRE